MCQMVDHLSFVYPLSIQEKLGNRKGDNREATQVCVN